MKKIFIFFLLNLFILCFPYQSKAQEASWPMAGANPQRTSWTAEQVNGKLTPDWYKTFKGAYILPRSQLIAANNTIFVSTSRGLYALDSGSGATKWVFATELPVGDTATYVNGTVYIGGFDRKMYALDANTGVKKWEFIAGSGFQINPLVVNNTVFAGNRDGYLYSLDAANGSLKWKFKTNGPIAYSSAYDNGVIYLGSNDGFAYAVNATSGQQVWKSAKLPGAGFHSWWPVVAGNYVIFSGSDNYRDTGPGAAGSMSNNLDKEIYSGVGENILVAPNAASQSWAHGATVLDFSKKNSGYSMSVVDYFENKPYRRTFFVLDKVTGQEKKYDLDSDGKVDYAPVLWLGSHSGTRYPPIVNSEGIVFVSNDLWSSNTIPKGQIVGWKPDTALFSLPNDSRNATDEPQGYAGGGSLIYWSRCCDRVGASFSVSSPGTSSSYFSYNLDSVLPGYRTEYYNPDSTMQTSPFSSFGSNFNGQPGKNGVYGDHGDTHAPIPYKGKVYKHNSNTVIAFGTTGSKTKAADATVLNPTAATAVPAKETLRSLLTEQIQKIISAGHLRTGFHGVSILDINWSDSRCGDSFLVDYFARPGETLYSLSIALPFITDTTVKNSLNTYLQNEFANFSPLNYKHIGWKDGAKREAFDTPPDVQSALSSSGPVQAGTTLYPFEFYGLWKYASQTAMTSAQAKTLFDSAKAKFPGAPSDSEIQEFPWKGNAHVAGLIGYLELEKMAGYGETAAKRSELTAIEQKVASYINKDSPWADATFLTNRNKGYCHANNAMRNFLYMTPELGTYLNTNAKSKVQEIVNYYNLVAPYWFVSQLEVTYGEGAIHHLYDYPSIFQAKALALKESYNEVSKYVDVAGFEKGDLFYIQNLVYALSASGTGPTDPPGTKPGDANGDGKVDGLDYVIWLNHYNQSATGAGNGDFNNSGKVDGLDYVIWLNNYLA